MSLDDDDLEERDSDGDMREDVAMGDVSDGNVGPVEIE